MCLCYVGLYNRHINIFENGKNKKCILSLFLWFFLVHQDVLLPPAKSGFWICWAGWKVENVQDRKQGVVDTWTPFFLCMYIVCI